MTIFGTPAGAAEARAWRRLMLTGLASESIVANRSGAQPARSRVTPDTICGSSIYMASVSLFISSRRRGLASVCLPQRWGTSVATWTVPASADSPGSEEAVSSRLPCVLQWVSRRMARVPACPRSVGNESLEAGWLVSRTYSIGLLRGASFRIQGRWCQTTC